MLARRRAGIVTPLRANAEVGFRLSLQPIVIENGYQSWP